ncbi:hypothetical protein AAL_00684 [Moelleriella libera RCEF 2490]|uniref:Uncharacterized protein n=1 Tax=Moelleriella libera RCEF 2490 TaxID=1081109 RepID=A0A166V2Z8_9HYPO|nr:hypothetical protein AAL_00684 [Moelleriella libera RCEF 2490]
MRAAVAAILLPFVAASALLDPRNGHCGGDNCARQVTGTRDGLSPASSRRTDCSSFMKTTVIPDVTTVIVTVTIDLGQEPAAPAKTKAINNHNHNNSKRGVEVRAATTIQAPSVVPAYAPACDNASRYSSACACWGITPVVSTAPAPTTTLTVTTTSDFCQEL